MTQAHQLHNLLVFNLFQFKEHCEFEAKEECETYYKYVQYSFYSYV
jgi:hypothetical protein